MRGAEGIPCIDCLLGIIDSTWVGIVHARSVQTSWKNILVGGHLGPEDCPVQRYLYRMHALVLV